MSSGFVSAGTLDEPVERDDEWRRVQQELEEERRQKAELGKQDGGKSLYEVLQQNKMAKQEAFEESIRLKNQFRSLDEDEVEFLDSILESTRAQEAAVKKETAEQLAEFHRQREEAERSLLDDPSSEKAGPGGTAKSPGEEEQWARSGKKRKRNKKDLLFPTKTRKSSAGEDVAAGVAHKAIDEPIKKGSTPATKLSTKLDIPPPKGAEASRAIEKDSRKGSEAKGGNPAPEHEERQQKPQTSSSLGLVSYGSDDDSD
ncbi:hypothetical protein PISL3812_02275 [Talaromyces islandicus]|uniref:FAM192A/Fyv6 N-terminal domain-containing protein n=1 Tax=Talaromyces islandicus TaxID=28573 RepID=A0A0U1LRT6_TALIS|nr:hypothetical protein PISL3812_02275 [Talaromyces islandicus]